MHRRRKSPVLITLVQIFALGLGFTLATFLSDSTNQCDKISPIVEGVGYGVSGTLILLGANRQFIRDALDG